VSSARLPVEGELPTLDGATGWFNSQPLTPSGLRGTVTMVDFWTGQGLVVIGVHTPEFSFEHDPDNVPPGDPGGGHHLSRRERQQLRGMAGLR
jgi:hypothetical protein